ncbi:NUDIX domain-containing protein [Lentibacillus halodurans]|uniref:NUDIX domain-containing protein n=1 Tax=Lentibacillus halodurans TaxID=237679 RepID=A0A1I0X028_9BACI|nr:CoA pyrophosphatase [Lentibacillus halodurans]SFA94174.1 NUDIX domain-containing protein [Lentibacillus halodurans]
MELQAIMNKIKRRTPSILGIEHFTKSAVLLPLVQRDKELHVLFEVRSHKLRRQPGEICFPGGRIEADDQTEQDAAIRETKEELGVSDQDISNVHPLDYLVTPFGMIVYTYTGLIDTSSRFSPNPSEVGETFTVPLSFFLSTEPKIHHVNLEVQPEENFPYELITGGENYKWQTRQMDEYFYIYEDKVIWGLTARVLSHFVDMLR